MDAHYHGLSSNTRIEWETTTTYVIHGKRTNVMKVGDNVNVYMDDESFADTFAAMMRFGIDQGLLCPGHPGDCEKKTTDCCAREAWACETRLVWDRVSMENFYECADPMSCGLYDRDDVASLADHANGDAR